MDEVISVFGSCSRERRDMALRLYYFAMQFVIEHEMGHAVAGHGQFAAEELCLPEINESEFRARSDSSTSNKIYAFLEERADYGSYFTIINYPVLRYVQTDHQEQPHERKAIIEEVKLKILAGASLAVFWMLCDVMEANGDVTAHEVWNDHPSSVARAISFCTTPIIAAQNKLSKAVSDIVEQGVYAAWDELFKLAGTSGLFRPFLQLRQLDLHESVYAGRELERSEAEAILRKLERYKYRS